MLQKIIRKKKDYIQDEEVVELFHHKARPIFPKWASRFPFHFHVRYFWEKKYGGIKYRILNPDCSVNWKAPESGEISTSPRLPPVASLKRLVLVIIRKFFSQRARNKSIDLLSLLQCPTCGSNDFNVDNAHAFCTKCNARFLVYLPVSGKNGSDKAA